MNPNKKPSELHEAVLAFKPHYWRAFGFALIGALLVLAPTAYMFEVYDRVVNSRSHITLAMLTLMVVLAYIVMEVLDWARSETMREAGQLLDRRMAPRVFQAMYESNLRRLGPPSVQPMNDFRTVRDFLHHAVVGAVMEAPISLVFMVILFLASPLLGWAAVAGAVVQVGLACQRTQHQSAAHRGEPLGDRRPAVCRRFTAQRRSHRGDGHAAAHPPALDGQAACVPAAAGTGLRQGGRLSGRHQVRADHDGLAAAGPRRLARP